MIADISNPPFPYPNSNVDFEFSIQKFSKEFDSFIFSLFPFFIKERKIILFDNEGQSDSDRSKENILHLYSPSD